MKRLALVVLAMLAAAPPAANAQRPAPTPEPNFAVDVAPRPCAYEGGDPYERATYENEGWPGPEYERYPGACQRMRFAYGPIHVKPGQNDVLIEPVKIEKPVRDGYVTRFEPNLVLPDGSVPPVEQVHLHHGTWLSYPEYGSGPFFAAGEEKTIAPFPRGYGMPVKATDQWLLLYMVHSAVQQPMEAYIVYDIDFVPKAAGDALGLKPAYPVWLDVRPSSYPVFNVQRDYGGADNVCTWPKEECAAHDPFGQKFTGQGDAGNGKGTDFEFPKQGEEFGKSGPFNGGTLIGIGGHLHPGGLTNDVDLIRPGGETVTRKVRTRRCRKAGRKGARTSAKRRRARRRCRTRVRTITKTRKATRIYTGVAEYWSREDKSKGDGPPTSWDFSERVNGLPFWGVHVKPGDKLRSNATYDTSYQSTYENMGISVALYVPAKEDGTPQAPGINPFQVKKDRREGCPSGGMAAKRQRLCLTGFPTHGHYAENGNYGGAGGQWNARPGGQPTSEVGVVNFQYHPGDLSLVSMTGVPSVKLGSTLRFTNLEGGLIYHTATTCGFPCLGPTGAAFPLADGRTSSGRPVDFDSSEMGVGVPEIGAAKQALDYQVPITAEEGYQPGEIVTYFCRVHPGMRGAFEVTVK
jgi:hypothetical protein